LENSKQLEVSIKDLKKDIEFKDEDIIIKINEIDNLKREVKEKVAEIKLKEAIIKKLEDEESFSQESEEEEQDLKKNYDQLEATCKFQGDNESESDGEYDLFQLEVVSDEEVYCCNICNKGFDSEEEVKEHLKLSHKKV
jgi:trehalose/maltose hydrolase-like predicted phosphorylase